MNQLLLPFALKLKFDWGDDCKGQDAHQSHHQKQREQNIPLFPPAAPTAA
jgi:hypothetical protein